MDIWENSEEELYEKEGTIFREYRFVRNDN